MLTHTLVIGFRGGDAITKQPSVEGGAEINLDELIPAATNDKATIFAMDVSQLKSLFMVSDRAVTIETNNSGAPINTFSLLPNVPFVWQVGGPALRDTAGTAVVTDITQLFITNPGAADALVQIRALFDPTV